MNLETSLEELDLSFRSYNCLKRANIYTLEDLIKTIYNGGIEALFKIRNLGRKSSEEVLYKLQSVGYSVDKDIDKYIIKLSNTDETTTENIQYWMHLSEFLKNLKLSEISTLSLKVQNNDLQISDHVSETDKKIENAIAKKLEKHPVILTDYYVWLVKSEKSYNSIKTYIDSTISFLIYRYGNSIPKDFYEHISVYHVSKYLETLSSQSYKATVWTALHSFFEFLVPRYISDNPVDSIKRPYIDKNIQKTYLTPQEVNTMLKNVKDLSNERMRNRDLCILMLGFYCGLKNNNIVSANINDIDWNKKHIVVHEKNQEFFYVPVSDNIMYQLRLWMLDRQKHFNATSPALFVSQINERLTSNTLSRIITKYSVGVDKNVTPHVMRNTFAITLYQKTKNLQLCSRYLNHKNISSTLKYIERLELNTSKEEVTTIVENIYSQQSLTNTDSQKTVVSPYIKFVRAPRYKNLTFNDIKLTESFWRWQHEKEINSKYACETFEQWCGHTESELPSYEAVFYYKTHFDKGYKLFTSVAEWYKASQFNNWIANNLTGFHSNSNNIFEITEVKLKRLLDTCVYLRNRAISYVETDSNGASVYCVNKDIAENLLPIATQDGKYMYPYRYGDLYAQQVIRAIQNIRKILDTTDFEKEVIFIICKSDK